MRKPRLRTTMKSFVAILCAACFLTMSLGSASRAIADDTWETWPKKTIVTEPWETWPKTPNPETDANGSAKAKNATKKGIFSGKSWWIAAGTAVVIGIGIAIAASGGGSEDGGSANPGHK